MSSADHNRDRKMRTIRLIGIGAAALTAAVFLFSRLVFSARETSGAAQPDSMWTAIGPEDSALVLRREGCALRFKLVE